MSQLHSRLVILLLVTLGVVGAVVFRALARTEETGLVVSTASVAERLGSGQVAVIATGSRENYDAAHIPGARFVSHDDLVTMTGDRHELAPPDRLARVFAEAGATDDRSIVLYGTQPMETGWVYMALASIGHGDHTFLLDGNLRAWREDGHAVSADPVAPARGRLSVKPAPDVVVDAGWVRERLEAPGVTVLDVRTSREWNQGRLPGATLVLWQDLFASMDTQRFKPRDEIRALLARAGAREGGQVVTYCAIGMRASLMYLAARHAGLDARVYVGSWQDWQRQAGYPIVR